jgi:TldD protein
MLDLMTDILGMVDAAYADVRYEVKRETTIAYRGHVLAELVSSSTDGFVLRVLDAGGLASVAFTDPQDATAAARAAVDNARLLGSRRDEPIAFAPTEPVSATVRPTLDVDPRRVPIDEKLALVAEYNAIPLAHPAVVTTDLRYHDLIREKCFVSSEGTRLQEDLVTTRVVGSITSRDGDLTQTVRVGFGGSNGYGAVRGRHELVEERTAIAVDLLAARPVAAGTYRAILDQRLTGVFTHEAFGHFSEADLVEDAPSLRQRLRLGTQLGTDLVSIVDDASDARQLGHYTYDDEGVAVRCTPLMKNGVLVGRLHSRRTAAGFAEPLSGHCVAEDYRYPPIVRMATIYMEPGDTPLEELMDRLGDGLYVANAMGGQTSGQSFTFGAQYGYAVRRGRKGEMLRDINVSGDLYRTLESISGVGNDLLLSEIGGCGKGQLNIRSCNGGPHVLVDSVVIGGA